MVKIVSRWAMCKCISHPKNFIDSLKDIYEEVWEFIESPSEEEMSDIIFCIGRTLGSLIGKPYISLPGDGTAITKIKNRMKMYGCIRSKRHLVFGKCPSEIN